MAPVNTGEVNKIIEAINANKVTGPDCIPKKFVRMSTDIIDPHLTNTINSNTSQKHYSENAKTVSVRPIFKKDDRALVKHTIELQVC